MPDHLLRADEVVRLVAEVQNLTSVMRTYIATQPQRAKTWLEPKELAGVLNVSTRTLGKWREQGRFREGSYRPAAKGFQYHSEKALEDAQRLQARICD